MTDWRAGMKAVCVYDKWQCACGCGRRRVKGLPVKGEVYTVFGVCFDGAELLYLDGFLPKRFYSDCFRPLVETHTDISIFTRMLDGAREPERADEPA
jgi:hypothetical protein